MDLLFIAPMVDGEEGAVAEVATNAGEGQVTGESTTTGETTLDPKGSNNNNQTETEAAPPQGGGYGFWIMIGAMILIMYFFMWRPEKKRRKQMEQFRQGIKKGDKVITAGGIYGVIKEVHETSLLIEVDSNVTLRIDKNMVVGDPAQGVMQK